VFALVDCNNFYASCERVFQPRLSGRPVIVLSNNDGCVIARSNEAKALGIAMGQPYFEIREKVRRQGVAVFSSNYTLYGDMSARVMECLRECTSDVEVYSIDEAFCDLAGFVQAGLEEHGRRLRQKVKQWTGIPVSVGIAATKTLAKAANKVAKKENGVRVLERPEQIEAVLRRLDVEDVWGIGRQWGALLKGAGIVTALDLRNAPDRWIRKHLHVVGLRTVHELRGICCIPLEDAPKAKQSIIVSRSFGGVITTLDEMLEASATYAARAGEELRSQGLLAGHVMLFLTTNRFNNDPFYANSTVLELPVASSYTPELIRQAARGIRRLWRPGYRYKKCGVMLLDLTPAGRPQYDLFDREDRQKQGVVMAALDAVNSRFGAGTLFYAGQGVQQSWAMKRGLKSPHYTTDWEALPKVAA
jgi:DNA polymerase V